MGPNQTKSIPMGPIWNTGGTETVISVPVSVLGPERAGSEINPTYQAFVTLQPDWLPFNSLGAGVANKRQYKTGKVPDLPHIIILTKLQLAGPHFYFT